MINIKGELSKRAIDQGRPHQVALEARFCTGDHYFTLHYFCKNLRLSQRGHFFYRDCVGFIVFCFWRGRTRNCSRIGSAARSSTRRTGRGGRNERAFPNRDWT